MFCMGNLQIELPSVKAVREQDQPSFPYSIFHPAPRYDVITEYSANVVSYVSGSRTNSILGHAPDQRIQATAGRYQMSVGCATSLPLLRRTGTGPSKEACSTRRVHSLTPSLSSSWASPRLGRSSLLFMYRLVLLMQPPAPCFFISTLVSFSSFLLAGFLSSLVSPSLLPLLFIVSSSPTLQSASTPIPTPSSFRCGPPFSVDQDAGLQALLLGPTGSVNCLGETARKNVGQGGSWLPRTLLSRRTHR